MAVKLNRPGELKFVKTLAVKYKLVPHIERALNEGEFSWTFDYEPKVGDDAWHPSGDCTPSLYELYQKARGVEVDNRVGMAKTFMVGHFWHQYLQHLVLHRLEFCSWKSIERRGEKWWGEPNPRPHPHREGEFIQAAPFHWVTGSADISHCEIPSHGTYMIDFKTMRSMDFRKPDGPEWALPKWECQGNIYMDFFGLEKALFIGINKDSPHELKEFEFHRNQDLIDALYNKWRLVSECLDEGIVPPEDEDYPLPLKGPK